MPIIRQKNGSFSKSFQANEQLNQLMLRYAQANNVSGVMGCLLKNADVNYKNGALLLTCIYLRHYKLLKLVLAKKPIAGLKEAIDLSEKDGNHKALELLNNYVAKNSIAL